MEIFNLKAGVEYIELNNLLKIFGWVGTGGEAKNVIKQGDVLVNGEIETRVTLLTINNVASIEVNFVKKLPTSLEDVKLSCETPSPKAPPSDLCSKITITRTIAKIIFNVISIFSITSIYSNFLLYQ